MAGLATRNLKRKEALRQRGFWRRLQPSHLALMLFLLVLRYFACKSDRTLLPAPGVDHVWTSAPMGTLEFGAALRDLLRR